MTIDSVTDMSVSPALKSAPQRSREATSQRLRASARTLFAERGLHKVTTHEIANRAGVASGTFYLHFKDKHDLFREIVFEAIESLKARLEVARQEDSRDHLAAMRQRASELLRFAEENGDVVRILFGRDHAGGGLGADVLDHLVGWVAEDLEHRRSHAEVPVMTDPMVAAQAIVGMWARVITWWAESQPGIDRDTVLETLVTMQLSGVIGIQSDICG